MFICMVWNSMSYSQGKTYNCTSQGYSTADNSEIKSYSYKEIITVDINDVLGGSISINNISANFNFRYDVGPKFETLVNKNNRTITTTYKGKMSQLNISIGDEVLVGIVESMDNNDLKVWVYTKKYDAFNQYFHLTKIE